MEIGTANTRPLVSVIIPTYNVEDFVTLTLDSTLNQGLPAGGLEVICVNDGSTDASGEILEEYASRYDFIKVVHQENSGGPGKPRNTGIGESRGKYLFFLDADDELTENALRDLVRTAEAEGSDVVLGKGEGINGRVVPGPVFRATKLDADIIDDNVYRTLSPWKLFRRSLVVDHEIRFLETLSIGEDQPFVARAYLNAKKISILADRPYARLRARGDGTNVTAASRSIEDYLELARAVITVIVAETDPGRLRDGMLARPLKRTLRPMLGSKLLALDSTERARVVQEMQRLVSAHYNDRVAGHLEGLDRIKMDLAVTGQSEPLAALVQWEHGDPGNRFEVGPAGIRYALPEGVRELVDDARAHAVHPQAELNLKHFDVESGVVKIIGDATIRGLRTNEHDVALRLQGRKSGSTQTIPAQRLGSMGDADGSGVFSVSFTTMDLLDDVWDLYVIQTIGGTEYAARLGSKRSPSLRAEPRYIQECERLRVVLYFTKGAGFLSCDIGLQIAAHRLPQAKVVGVVPDHSGSVNFILSAPGATDVDARESRSSMAEGRPKALVVETLSNDLFSVTARVEDEREAHISFDVSNGNGTSRALPAEGLSLPTSASGLAIEFAADGSERFVVKGDPTRNTGIGRRGHWAQGLKERFLG
ncbi:hypothetical protein CFK39_05665 [Brachybacterium avium]|uniref:Uncharacterized protein n=1 Tax=Brachybacterium avium TaxID=2017485 RepID=A0A220UBW9_9MICO|nr:glycosyltransferase [Brachybacterium avium]ASK65402.1 hypothetical protein CFK39_05665 [Brachybacterium avium]